MSFRTRYRPWFRTMYPETGEDRIVGWFDPREAKTTEDEARRSWARRLVRDLWSELAGWYRHLRGHS